MSHKSRGLRRRAMRSWGPQHISRVGQEDALECRRCGAPVRAEDAASQTPCHGCGFKNFPEAPS